MLRMPKVRIPNVGRVTYPEAPHLLPKGRSRMPSMRRSRQSGSVAPQCPFDLPAFGGVPHFGQRRENCRGKLCPFPEELARHDPFAGAERPRRAQGCAARGHCQARNG